MPTDEAIQALGMAGHIESISTFHELGEAMHRATVREFKEACELALAEEAWAELERRIGGNDG